MIITRMTITKLMNGTSSKLWMFVENISLCDRHTRVRPLPLVIFAHIYVLMKALAHIRAFDVSIINNSTFSSVWLLMDILPFIRKVAMSIGIAHRPSTCVPFCPFGYWCVCVIMRARVCVGANASK